VSKRFGAPSCISVSYFLFGSFFFYQLSFLKASF